MNLHATLESARSVTTTAATMRTLTSPTSTPEMPIAIWRTDLPAGAVGPEHAIDTDQFVVVVDGAIDVDIDGRTYRVAEADGIKLPSGVMRVIKSADNTPASTITVGHPDAHATVGQNDPVPVPWTA
jgi:quercetin dioxygenase-like cupin family protein